MQMQAFIEVLYCRKFLQLSFTEMFVLKSSNTSLSSFFQTVIQGKTYEKQIVPNDNEHVIISDTQHSIDTKETVDKTENRNHTQQMQREKNFK